MANWTTIRNKYLDNATNNSRGAQFVVLMYELLAAAGWTLIGQGGGTGGGFNWGGANIFPAFPSFPAGAGMWFLMENADGVQALFKMESTRFYIDLVWSPSGAFVQGAADEDTPPANPVDAVVHPAGSYNEFGHATQNPYYQFAYSDDGNSFILWSRCNGYAFAAAFFLKLEGVAVADALPTYCPYHVGWSASATFQKWEWDHLSYDSSDYSHQRGVHPSGVAKRYQLSEVTWQNAQPFEDCPADPITGEQPRIAVISACWEVGFKHIRGLVPGIWRIPGTLADGDKLDSNTYIVIGDYCLPWGSTDTMNF